MGLIDATLVESCASTSARRSSIEDSSISISILSLGVNLSVLQFVLNQYMPEIKAFAQLVGIASGTLVNYLGVKRWIFNEK